MTISTGIHRKQSAVLKLTMMFLYSQSYSFYVSQSFPKLCVMVFPRLGICRIKWCTTQKSLLRHTYLLPHYWSHHVAFCNYAVGIWVRASPAEKKSG